MKDERSDASDTSPPKGLAVILQTPPDVKIIIAKVDRTPLIKMAGIGEDDVGDRYFKNTEYWRHGDLASENLNVAELTFIFERWPSNFSEDDVDRFFQGMTPSFETVRPAALWTPGRRNDTAGRSLYLYSMPDPESINHNLGVLLEVEPAAQPLLKAVAFYKTWSPVSREVFPARLTSFTAPLKRVRGMGTNSTNPVDMVLTHYALMGS